MYIYIYIFYICYKEKSLHLKPVQLQKTFEVPGTAYRKLLKCTSFNNITLKKLNSKSCSLLNIYDSLPICLSKIRLHRII